MAHMDSNFVLLQYHIQHKCFGIYHYMKLLTILAIKDSLIQRFLLIHSLRFYLMLNRFKPNYMFLKTNFDYPKQYFLNEVQKDLSILLTSSIFIILQVKDLQVLLWKYDHFLKWKDLNKPSFIFVKEHSHQGN